MTDRRKQPPLEVILSGMSDARGAHWVRWGPNGDWKEVLQEWPHRESRRDPIQEITDKIEMMGDEIRGWVEKAEANLYAVSDPHDVNTLSIFDPKFPPMLRRVPYPPWVLHMNGEKRTLTTGVAIVGSRETEDRDLEAAESAARWAADNGIPVITGMARGVDRAAVLAATDQGGTVIGVTPGGPHEIIPKESRDAYEAAYRQGCVVTEVTRMPRLHRWSPHTAFLRRNRLISGLARVVIVCSSKIRKGSFNQVVWAKKQGCPVIGYAPEPRQSSALSSDRPLGQYYQVDPMQIDKKALETWNQRAPVQASLG